MKIYQSSSLNPFENLELEDRLLRESEDEILLLWQSTPSVVMGRFQNPFEQTNPFLLSEKNIHLVRRQSGGGCVFHDEGNINFALIKNKINFHDNDSYNILKEILHHFDISLEQGQKNDFLVDNLKVSGSAMKKTKNRVLHHFTLLCQCDLDLLSLCMKPLIAHIDSKAVKSRPAKVQNIGVEVKKIINYLGPQIVDAPCGQKWQADEWLWAETPAFFLHGEEIKNGRVSSTGEWVQKSPLIKGLK